MVIWLGHMIRASSTHDFIRLLWQLLELEKLRVCRYWTGQWPQHMFVCWSLMLYIKHGGLFGALGSCTEELPAQETPMWMHLLGVHVLILGVVLASSLLQYMKTLWLFIWNLTDSNSAAALLGHRGNKKQTVQFYPFKELQEVREFKKQTVAGCRITFISTYNVSLSSTHKFLWHCQKTGPHGLDKKKDKALIFSIMGSLIQWPFPCH